MAGDRAVNTNDAANVEAVDAPPAPTGPRALGYLPGIDGLRAISVLAVLVYHHYFVGGHEPGFAPGGYLGVEVFFVVSGYLITSLLLAERRDQGSISLRRFWFRRARRLLPALWLLLAGVVTYTLLFLPDAVGNLKGAVAAALTYTSNWYQIIAGRSYFQDVGRPDLLKHLWSLAIEEQFYLFWPPLLIVGLRKFGRRTFMLVTLGVAGASAMLMAALAVVSPDRAYYGTDTRMSGLLLGAVMAFVFAPYRIRGVPGRNARQALDLAGVVGLLVLLWCFANLRITAGDNHAAVFRGGFLLVDLATLLVIAAVVHPVSDLGRVLGCKPLRWIGLRSYSLYLWHYPIFCVTRPGGASDGGDFGHFFDLRGWPVFVLRLVLSVGAAELSYTFVEQPVRNGAIGRYVQRVRTSAAPQRARLAFRGFAAAGALGAFVAILCISLITATPEPPTIPGLNTASASHVQPDEVDPAVAAALREGTSTTQSPTTTRQRPSTTKPRTSSTTKPKGKTPRATAPATTAGTKPKPSTTPPPTMRAAALPAATLAVGDSVMLGAKHALQREIPGIAVDAVVSRQFGDAISVLQGYKNLGALPDHVVIHLGTNGAFSDSQFDTMMNVLGRERHVYFVTAREPRAWEADVNTRLHNGAARWKNVKIIEWHDIGGPHDNWFVSDGVHLTDLGQQGYANLVRHSLQQGG
jgi:peptidoglycan/LPS O-acetylase OafA/YrhL